MSTKENMKKKIIFFDTETTGNTKEDYLCQIAYKSGDNSFVEIFKPPIKIPAEASAIHHISNKMVEGKDAFQKSPAYLKIKKLFEDPNNIVVAHNACFDINILEKEDIRPVSYICTLRVARHLDKENKLDKYNLQYLRYFLEMEIDATAHDAMGDVLVLEQLFDRLKKRIMEEEKVTEEEAIEKMVEISSHPSIFHKLNFGKHKGKKIQEVLDIDRGWLEWLLREKEKGDQIDEDWIYTLKHYLENK